MSRPLLVLVALAVTLPGLASVVAAQSTEGSASVDLGLPTLAAPVSPAEPENKSVNVRYQWDGGIATENVTVDLSYVDGPSWLNASFTPSTVEFERPQDQASGVDRQVVNLTLDVSRDARAYQEAEATFRAESSSSGTLPSATTEEALAFESGFAGRLVAELPRGNLTAWGGVLERVPIAMENTANGPIEVDVRVDREPADARLTSPDTVELGHEPGNRSLREALEVRTPWSLSIEGPVELVLEAAHATEGTELAERRLSFHLEGRSAVPVPGPGPWAALAALGLAVILGRGDPSRPS